MKVWSLTLALAAAAATVHAIDSTHWRVTFYDKVDCKGNELGSYQSDNDHTKFDFGPFKNATSFGWDKGNAVEVHIDNCLVIPYDLQGENKCQYIDPAVCSSWLKKVYSCNSQQCGSDLRMKAAMVQSPSAHNDSTSEPKQVTG